MKSLGLVFLLLSLSTGAEAKIFSFNSEAFAPYIRGDYQFSSLGSTPYSQSSGTGNSFNKSYTTLPSYEFGFLYSFDQVALRFGFGVLKPLALKDISGSNASGTELFKVDSDVSGYVPKIGIDLVLKQWPRSRVFMGAEVGLANLTIQNSYSFTTDGQAAYPSMTNFREETKGTGTQLEYYLGGEYIAFDNTSMVFLGGFRYMKVDGLTHGADVTSFQGAVTKGAEATRDAGGARSLDFSGSFVSVAFRFYLY